MTFRLRRLYLGRVQSQNGQNIVLSYMTMKLTRIVGMLCLSTMLKFQVKKLSGTLLFNGKTAEKSLFTIVTQL